MTEQRKSAAPWVRLTREERDARLAAYMEALRVHNETQMVYPRHPRFYRRYDGEYDIFVIRQKAGG